MRRPPTTPRVSSSHAKKSGSRPPKKKARVSAPLEPSEPPSEPQPPAIESQIPFGMTPEVVIRRPMVTQPPIEAKAQRFLPSAVEIPYGAPDDSQGFLLSRVALDFYQSMTTHHVRDPTVIYFTIDGHHGILGAKHIAEALRIPYKPAHPEDYRVWAHHSQSDMVHILSREASTCPYLISEGFFFGPHHLIMVALLYFEEKLERRCIFREIFTLNKWTSMTTYDAEPGAPSGPEHLEIPHSEHPEEPQPVEIPADMRAPAPIVPSTRPMPEVAPSVPHATPGTPPVIPSTDSFPVCIS
ncbi:hypothetical protein CK203_111540 [Vitis vinifera]|uniref:Uncharacterized protein n=1 Tax=Vitis vinifera TaxID=29760 RepID=A0A438FGF9_VITVI|nr:hypothetical protein CK203_111540 [Vitis vinifera]